jgi:hypothetical protein
MNLLPATDGPFSAHSMVAAFYVNFLKRRNTKSHFTDVVYDSPKPEQNYDWKQRC